MNIYNLKNIKLQNIKLTEFHIDSSKQIFINNILKFLKLYDTYDYYRNIFYNHPSFNESNDNSTDFIGIVNLFRDNNIPIVINNSETFSSINKEKFKYILINHIMISNAIMDLYTNVNIAETTKIEYINSLTYQKNQLVTEVETDINNILKDNYKFITVFGGDSEFFTFITDDDYNLLCFIRNLIDYFLITTDTNYKIHYDIINLEIKKIFSINILSGDYDELINTIKEGISIIPSLYNILYKKQYDAKYLGITIILYILNLNIGLYYSLIINNNLYNDITNSKIFIF